MKASLTEHAVKINSQQHNAGAQIQRLDRRFHPGIAGESCTLHLDYQNNLFLFCQKCTQPCLGSGGSDVTAVIYSSPNRWSVGSGAFWESWSCGRVSSVVRRRGTESGDDIWSSRKWHIKYSLRNVLSIHHAVRRRRLATPLHRSVVLLLLNWNDIVIFRK